MGVNFIRKQIKTRDSCNIYLGPNYFLCSFFAFLNSKKYRFKYSREKKKKFFFIFNVNIEWDLNFLLLNWMHFSFIFWELSRCMVEHWILIRALVTDVKFLWEVFFKYFLKSIEWGFRKLFWMKFNFLDCSARKP